MNCLICRETVLASAWHNLRGGVIFMAESRKGTKKGRNTGIGEKILRKPGKEKCDGNRKMTFLSHGKPENLKISAENGKLILKSCGKPENTPKRQ